MAARSRSRLSGLSNLYLFVNLTLKDLPFKELDLAKRKPALF